MNRVLQKAAFRLKDKFSYYGLHCLQIGLLRMRGASISLKSSIEKVHCNWPHQLAIGEGCRIERHVVFKFDGPWKSGPNILIGRNVFIGCFTEFNISHQISVGDDTLIASGCRFVDHNHGFAVIDTLIAKQPCDAAAIRVDSNVWLGCNVVVLNGVTIGSGAVVGAGAVVTKSIPPNEVWGGVPAKFIRKR